MYRYRSVGFRKALASFTLMIACAYTPVAANAQASASPEPTLASAMPMGASRIQAAPIEATPIESSTVAPPEGREPEAKLEYNVTEVKDAGGTTHLSAGAQFPVTISKRITTQSAAVGDLVEAQLAVDLKIGDKLIASKGASVLGHVIAVEKSRHLLKAELVPSKRWLRMAGSLGIQFDEIINDRGEHIPLVAVPATQARVIKDSAVGRVLGVNKDGNVASPLSSQVKSQAIHMALRAGASAAGPFSFGAVPVAFACLGAISPSFAFCHPVGTEVKHRRLKGFGMGLIQGIPGGFLISDAIIKGPEATIEPGDVFQAAFKQDFTGEKATEPAIPTNADANVKGVILPAKDKESKGSELKGTESKRSESKDKEPTGSMLNVPNLSD